MDQTFFPPHCPREEQERHGEDRSVCLTREHNETRIEGEEISQNQRGARFEFVAEKIRQENQRAPCKGGHESREEICAFDDREKYTGEENIGRLRRKDGRFTAGDGE